MSENRPRTSGRTHAPDGACDHSYSCHTCQQKAAVLEDARWLDQQGPRGLAVYQQQIADPTLAYALLSHEGKMHLRDCPVVRNAAERALGFSSVRAVEDDIATWGSAQLAHRYPELPVFLSREEAEANPRPGCEICGPALPPMPPRTPRFRIKRSGLGWPTDGGRCAKSPSPLSAGARQAQAAR